VVELGEGKNGATLQSTQRPLDQPDVSKWWQVVLRGRPITEDRLEGGGVGVSVGVLSGISNAPKPCDLFEK